MSLVPPRRRINSMSDNSAPSSNTSEGSEIQDWNSDGEPQSLPAKLLHDTLGLLTENGNTSGNEEDCEVQMRPQSGVVTEYEQMQIENFFGGLGTQIYVSFSLANLYESLGKKDWRLVYTGIPVLLYDKGCTKSRNTPKITFVLAERGTCFALWKDTIDNLSDYQVAADAFHTICLSTDHRRVIGFSFDSTDAAKEVWVRIKKLISDPENIALSAPGRKKKPQKKVKPVVLPPKSQISTPCQFNHVTSVTKKDSQRYFSLQAFMTKDPQNHRLP